MRLKTNARKMKFSTGKDAVISTQNIVGEFNVSDRFCFTNLFDL